MARLSVEDRFWSKVEDGPDWCRLWKKAGTNPDGYPNFKVDGRTVGAHRWAYEHFVGPIPEGMQVGHVCHDQAVAEGRCDGGPCIHRRCVERDHLELQTSRENVSRGRHGMAIALQGGLCQRGHDDWYIRPSDGRRWCRTCQMEATRRRLTRESGRPSGLGGALASRRSVGGQRCQRGHDDWVVWADGRRRCRTCQRDRRAVT